MTNDPIADMLTRVRNALRIRRDEVEMPFSRMRKSVADVLVREGYLRDAKPDGEGTARKLKITLKYGPNGEMILRRIDRVSASGRRVYRSVGEIPHVLDGLGIMVVSTSKGVLSDREARRQKVGGELICRVY